MRFEKAHGWGWRGVVTFIGAFLQLPVVGGLLHDVENLLRQRFVGDRPGCLRQICHCESKYGFEGGLMVLSWEEF
jgi:hypothetical protein